MQYLRFLIIFILFNISTLSYSKHPDEYWNDVPKLYHDRYNEASMQIDQAWVFTFADSLDKLADNRKIDAMHYYAAEIRCHNYFYKQDSLNFIKNSEKAREWAIKCQFGDLYYCEMVNLVIFYIYSNNKRQAQKTAQKILEEAKGKKHANGMYYGYSALGMIFQEKRDYARAIANFQMSIECFNNTKDAKPEAKSQIYYCIAYNYLGMRDYTNGIRYCKMGLDLTPDNEEIEVLLATAYYFSGDYASFQETYKKIQARTTYDTAVRAFFMDQIDVLYLILQRDYTEALKTCDKIELPSNRIRFRGEVYKKMNDWKNAYSCLEQLTRTDDSLSRSDYNEELAEMASELDTVYQVSEKDEQILRQKYWLIIGIITLIGSAISTIFIVSRYKVIKDKNKALVANIDNLIKYKQKVLELEHEKYSKQKEALQVSSDAEDYAFTSDDTIIDDGTGTVTIPQTNTEDDADASTEDSSESKDANHSAIARFIYELTSRKLFTDPNFNRDTLIDELHIQKRTFTKMFEAHTGTTFKEYITSLRLEYAAQMIKEHPEYTMEAIAMDCGITSYVTFHRNFTRHFGIAPSSYRTRM